MLVRILDQASCQLTQTPLSVFFIEPFPPSPSSPSPIILFKRSFDYFSSSLLLHNVLYDSYKRDLFGFAKQFEKVAKSRTVASPLNFRLITYARYLSLSSGEKCSCESIETRRNTHSIPTVYTPFSFSLVIAQYLPTRPIVIQFPRIFCL